MNKARIWWYILVSIIHLRGHGFLNNLILSAEFVVATNTIKLKCLSSKEPINHVADFFVDHVSADIVTLSRGKCYHSLGECSENICMCSKDEFSFTWMFNPTDTLQTYKLGCEVRSFDEITNQIVTTQASMVFDGSDFFEQLPTHVLGNQGDETKPKVKDIDSNIPIIACVSSVGVLFLGCLMILVILICYRNREQTLRMDSHNIEIEECLSLSKPLMRPKQKGETIASSKRLTERLLVWRTGISDINAYNRTTKSKDNLRHGSLLSKKCSTY